MPHDRVQTKAAEISHGVRQAIDGRQLLERRLTVRAEAIVFFLPCDTLVTMMLVLGIDGTGREWELPRQHRRIGCAGVAPGTAPACGTHTRRSK